MSEVAAPQSGVERAPQRRYLSVLFSDLSDSTRLGASLEAEVYAELLAQLRQLMRDTVKTHGGLVARLQGDGMLAIFGHPQPAEDDGQRAASAALALHVAVRRLRIAGVPETFTMHSGIHSGMVLLSDGDVELGRFELLGNVPNVAARLASLAEADQLIVSEETLGPRMPLFQAGERQLLNVRGHPLPLAAYEIRGRAPQRPRLNAPTVRGLAPFVGRDEELAALAAALEQTRQGRPVLVALEGNAGLGKTRLVEEFLRQPAASACAQHFGYCENQLSAVPLQPFLQMLRAWCGITPGMPLDEAANAAHAALARLGPGVAAQRPELLRLLSLPLEPGQRPGNAQVALQALFSAEAADQTLLLVLDDWHWADDASQQTLSALLALPAPLLVLLTTRGLADTDPLSAKARRLALAPLGLAETGRAVESLLPGAAHFVTQRIHEQAGGNPLFIEELCHAAAAVGAARWRVRGGGGAAWLSASIEARVARLPEAQAELVRAAAVVGNTIPRWLLERLLGRVAEDDLLRQLADQDFIFPTEQAGLLRFKHGIAREAIYEAIGLQRRRALHLQVAESLNNAGVALSETDNYEALAYHYGAGGELERAARYSELAGDKALAAFALDRARSQYCAALDALDKLGLNDAEAQRHWSEIVHKLGVPCVYDPLGIADALELFRRGAELARASGDAATLARSLYWLGYVCYAKGEARAARRHCEAALAAARSIGDERLAAQVRATLGQILCAAADYDAALAQLDDAIDAKRLYSHGSRSIAVGSAYSLSCKGLALGDRGEFAQAYECLDLALSMVGGTGHQVESSIRGWQSTVLIWQGRWGEAVAAADAGAQVAEQVRSSHLYAMTCALGGYARWMDSGDAAGLRAIEDAIRWIEARSGRLFSSLNYGWLTDVLVAQGRHAEARGHGARALWRGRASDRIGEAMAARALALCAAANGDMARARQRLQLAQRSAAARGSAHEAAQNLLCAARLDLQAGQAAAARAALDAALNAFDALGMAWHSQQAERLLAAAVN